MVGPARGESKAGRDIRGLEIGELPDNLFGRQTGREKIQDIDHADPHAANALSAAALLRIDGDSLKYLGHVADPTMLTQQQFNAGRRESTAMRALANVSWEAGAMALGLRPPEP